MVISDGIAIVVGVVAGKKIPANVIKYISATIFIVFGALIIFEVLRNRIIAL
jgi:putative Ca2+/H+ antiporter (TMEM165/GDT1 family)